MIPLYKAHVPESALSGLAEVLTSGHLAEGAVTRRFEAGLAEYLGNPRLISCGDEASATVLALHLAGVGPGDEVLASPMACVAVNMPILNVGARPVWCDVDPLTGNLDPEEIGSRVTAHTKAVLFAHWAGDVADVEGIQTAAQQSELKVVECAGEALGAEYRGRRIGNTGTDYVVFSFYGNRHLTTGEGAALTFSDEAERQRALPLKRFGIDVKTFRDELGQIRPEADIPAAGYNTYLNNVAATIGLTQLPTLVRTIERYQSNGSFYDHNLQGIPGVELLARPGDRQSAYWVYTLLAERRDELLRALRGRNIYASTVHLRNDTYSCFGTGLVNYPGLAYFAERCLSIPCGWWVSDQDRQYVVECIRQGW